jgi:hypothetical protein
MGSEDPMALDPLAPLRLGFRIGIGVLRFELRIAERLLGLDRPEPVIVVVQPEPDIAASEPAPGVVTRAPAWEREPEPEPRPEPRAPVPEPRAPAAVPVPEPPVHIDTEPELVGEFAEPGAEEGAGPEIHVDEPWEGYRQMRAADIRDRVVVAGPEELAVIQLYEGAHRRRRMVLDAVERRSKELANTPGAS